MTHELTMSSREPAPQDAPAAIEDSQDASASILSMPDPTSVQYHPIEQAIVPHDHSDHDEYGSDSEVESESSFPSVSSSFFFSSPASVASHGPSEDSHEEDGEPGMRATRELVVPSLSLPEPAHYPLETPHASKFSNAIRLLIVAPSDASLSEKLKNELDEALESSNQVYVHTTTPIGHGLESVITTIVDSFTLNELFTAVVVVSEEGLSSAVHETIEALSPLLPVIHLYTCVSPSPSSSPSPRDNSSSSSDDRSSVLSVSSVQQLHNLLIEQAQLSQQLRSEALEKFMKWASHRRNGDDGSSQLKTIQSVVERRAHSRHGRGRAHGRRTHELGRHVKDDTIGRSERNMSHQVDSEGSWRQFKAQWEASWENIYSWQGQEQRKETLSQEVAIKLHDVESRTGTDRQDREGEELSSSAASFEEEELLRTARISSVAPSSFVIGTGTLRPPKYSRSKTKTAPLASRSRALSSSSSSSPLPATSPSLPATAISSSLPSTMPSSLSLSESLFVSSDELPEIPFHRPVPLLVAFPFHSSVPSPNGLPLRLYPHSYSGSRDSSQVRARSQRRGRSPYITDKDFSPELSPFVLDLTAGHFDPLYLPSFIALSFSLLAPLRRYVWAATRRGMRRLLTAPFVQVRRKTRSTENSGMIVLGGEETNPENKEELLSDDKSDDKLAQSGASLDSIENENDHDPATSLSSFSSISMPATPPAARLFHRFPRVIWPTGVMLVGGFLLGFAVGYLSETVIRGMNNA